MSRFELPEASRLRALSLGEPGQAWIDSLDENVDSLADEWALTVGGVHSSGSASLVLDVVSDGRPSILKIGLPDSADLEKETSVYRAAAGVGYAELYALDSQRNAILLERLGVPLDTLGLPVDEQLEIICSTLKLAWCASTDISGLMSGAEKCDWLTDFIQSAWAEHDHPCNEATLERVLSFAAARKSAFDVANSVLCHGDAHELNTLQAREGFKLVDPDALIAEPACDLSVPMRGWNEQLLQGDTVRLAVDRCQLLSRLTGVDADAIWQWGYVERVSTGLVLYQIGLVEEGETYLKAAEALNGVSGI